MLTFGRRGAAALRDRIEARIAAGRPPGRCTSRWCAPSRRTPSACCAGPPPSGASRRPGCSPAPSRTWSSASCWTSSATRGRPGRLAGARCARALRTRAFAGQLRDLLLRAAERGVGPVELARLGEQLGRADWPAAARFLREYVAVLALRDATTRGSRRLRPRPSWSGPPPGCCADDPELLAAERAPARRTSTSTSWPTPTRPRSTCWRWSPAAARRWSRSPTRTRRRSPSAAPTRPGCATSRTGSARPPGRRPPQVTADHVATGPAPELLGGDRAGWRRRLRGPAAAPSACDPLPGRARPGVGARCARSARRPARRPTWRTRCARRTCSTACRGRGWR